MQILSLGAGFDVTYFWILDQIESGALPATLKEKLVYIEVDYYDVVEKKIHGIKKSETLSKLIWSSPEEMANHGPEIELST